MNPKRPPEADHAALARQRDLLPEHFGSRDVLPLELELDRVDLRVRADAVERVLGRERRRPAPADEQCERPPGSSVRTARPEQNPGDRLPPRRLARSQRCRVYSSSKPGPRFVPRRLLALAAERELEIEEQAGAHVASGGEREPAGRLLAGSGRRRGPGPSPPCSRWRSPGRRPPSPCPRSRRRCPGPRTAGCPTSDGRSRCRRGCRPGSSTGPR